MSDNAPERMYMTKAHAEARTSIMKNCTICKMYPTDIEYIHKGIADKHEKFVTAVAYSCGYDYARDEAKKELDEILKPIREIRTRFDDRALWQAIKETLERAGK